MAHKEFKDCKG
jgi:hypothetical protein